SWTSFNGRHKCADRWALRTAPRSGLPPNRRPGGLAVSWPQQPSPEAVMNEFLQRFTVGKRMFAGFGFLLLLMAAIAVVSATSLSTLEKHLETIAVERVTKTALANTLYDSANLLNINMQAMILA